ncbi:hypothetical protein FACS1894141_2380 [Spirochaetia bacterium]|nr:hypothetical protein FACS1894141_2380 [Spirochaetia bacterium]
MGGNNNLGLRFFCAANSNRSRRGFLFNDNDLTAFAVIQSGRGLAFGRYFMPFGSFAFVFCPLNEFYLWF